MPARCHVALVAGSVCGINAAQEIWQWQNGRWSKLDGAAVHVACNGGAVWCVNAAGMVRATTRARVVDGALRRRFGDVMVRCGTTYQTECVRGGVVRVLHGATQVAGAAKEICVGVDGTVYMVGVSQVAYRWENNNVRAQCRSLGVGCVVVLTRAHSGRLCLGTWCACRCTIATTSSAATRQGKCGDSHRQRSGCRLLLCVLAWSECV
jgi:hypothetical protein